MSILTQFEILTPEEIILIYESLEKSIKFHKENVANWNLYKKELKEQAVDMQLVIDFDKTDVYYQGIQDNIKKFDVIIEKIKSLKEVVNDE